MAKSRDSQQTLKEERAANVQDRKMLEDTVIDIIHSEMSLHSDQVSQRYPWMERAKASSPSMPSPSR